MKKEIQQGEIKKPGLDTCLRKIEIISGEITSECLFYLNWFWKIFNLGLAEDQNSHYLFSLKKYCKTTCSLFRPLAVSDPADQMLDTNQRNKKWVNEWKLQSVCLRTLISSSCTESWVHIKPVLFMASCHQWEQGGVMVEGGASNQHSVWTVLLLLAEIFLAWQSTDLSN